MTMRDRREYFREYYQRNKPAMAKRKAWRQKHDLDYRLRIVLRTIVQRCEDPRHRSYPWYGGKGIKNFLTLSALIIMWHRDGADKMKRPSIDREDSTKDYTFSNCVFRPFRTNILRGWESRRRLSNPLIQRSA